MTTLNRIRPDLLLLLSLLLMILLHPLLDRSTLRRLSMEVLAVIQDFCESTVIITLKWASLAAFFAVTVVGLFEFLRRAREVTEAHLYTAVSIYLMLGLVWFSVYCAVDTYFPGSILQGGSVLTHREDQLLYFSLITLSATGISSLWTRKSECWQRWRD